MGRILALDIGSKRIGLAITDEDKMISQPISDTPSPEEAASYIKLLVEKFGVEKILVGLPKSMSGEEGKQVEAIKSITESITKYLDIPLEYFDERLTTKRAEQLSGVNIPIDALAAQQLLEDYLKNQKANK